MYSTSVFVSFSVPKLIDNCSHVRQLATCFELFAVTTKLADEDKNADESKKRKEKDATQKVANAQIFAQIVRS